MKAEQRRKEISLYLTKMQKPVTGTALSSQFGVSRQIIVQDISVLKASGYDIISTRDGYVMHKTPHHERVFKVKHLSNETESELRGIVDLGGTIVDVFVWHKVYGKVSAKLWIYTLEHVDKFMEGVRTGKSSELMHITGGYHYHTVRAESTDVLDKIENYLQEKNFLVAGE